MEILSSSHGAKNTTGARRARGVKVLFVASEIFPLAKTGGLADVCGSLPPELARLGFDMRLLMPGYPTALEQLDSPCVVADLGQVLPGAPARLISGFTPDSGLPIWLVDSPALFQRPGSVYLDEDGREWIDNALRFGLLCHVAARIGLGQTALTWRPDIVHANDWHTGLVPLLVSNADPGEKRPRVVFTIHNAAFQGNVPFEMAAPLGLPAEAFTAEGAEFYGRLSFLKAGVRFADRLTTVSPTYACELRTPEFGLGLEGLFTARGTDLVGIMNGINVKTWDPEHDPHLAVPYSAKELQGKQLDKASLQHKAGLDIDPGAPLVMYISRLTTQKMADVVLQELPAILASHPHMQFVLHGRGEHGLEQGFSDLAGDYPGRVSVRIGYEEAYAHQLHGGADMLLHGSRFEPCGLNQLYAMRYGTLPIVRRVGGLADSVTDANGTTPEELIDATGFVFEAPTGAAMNEALSRAITVYDKHPEEWMILQKQAMSADSSWASSARAYARLYSELIPKLIGMAAQGSLVPVPACAMPMAIGNEGEMLAEPPVRLAGNHP